MISNIYQEKVKPFVKALHINADRTLQAGFGLVIGVGALFMITSMITQNPTALAVAGGLYIGSWLFVGYFAAYMLYEMFKSTASVVKLRSFGNNISKTGPKVGEKSAAVG